MIRGVIFDLDGVLVTTDELHYRAWKQIADQHGVCFDRRINERLRGVSRMASLEILLERATRAYSPDEKASMAERKNTIYRESLRTLTPADILPGASETLAALRARAILIAVASASRNAPFILQRVGFAGAFDAVVDGSDVRHPKPHPETFLLAAQRLGLPPADCLVVEDARAGIEAGRRAGMAVLGIGTRDSLPGVERVVRSLAETTIDELLNL